MGIIADSKNPWRLKNACDLISGRSVNNVMRRKFFFRAKSMAYSSNC